MNEYVLSDEAEQWLIVKQLTKREREIVRETLVCDNARQISEKLFVCEKTIKFHITNIYRKLGVKSLRNYYRQILSYSVKTTDTESYIKRIMELERQNAELKKRLSVVLPYGVPP